MTSCFSEEYTCSVCGAKNKYRVIASTNALGSADLDLRPPEMQRSTMGMWVQECPDCGYVSGQVSDESTVTKQWLQSEEYVTCNGIDFKSDSAKKFFKYYMINLEDENQEDSFFAILHAAWACDDANDSENAKCCRKLAIPIAEELVDKKVDNADAILLMKADLLRRAEDFEALISEYCDIKFDNDIMNDILTFQLKKAGEKDSLCYRVEDVRDNDNELLTATRTEIT
ncbi:MAG: hypothetical protein ACI4KL_02045 [Lentihominibacter sp.]